MREWRVPWLGLRSTGPTFGKCVRGLDPSCTDLSQFGSRCSREHGLVCAHLALPVLVRVVAVGVLVLVQP